MARQKGSFTEESDGETTGVLILLAATVIEQLFNYRFGPTAAYRFPFQAFMDSSMRR